MNMELPAEWVSNLAAWASRRNAIRELWLFGSQAMGHAGHESDVDIAVALMAPKGKHDWALAEYIAKGDEWQRELSAIVGRHVSLEAIVPGTPEDTMVRQRGKLLWRRSGAT